MSSVFRLSIRIDCLTSSGCQIQFDSGGRTPPLPPGQSCFISMSISLSTLLPHAWTVNELVGTRNARQWIDGFLSEWMEVLPHLEVRLWCWKSELVATKRSGLREIMTSSITSTSSSPKPSPYIWMESLLTDVSIVIRACQPNRLVTATPLTLPNLDGQSKSFPIVSLENDSKPKSMLGTKAERTDFARNWNRAQVGAGGDSGGSVGGCRRQDPSIFKSYQSWCAWGTDLVGGVKNIHFWFIILIIQNSTQSIINCHSKTAGVKQHWTSSLVMPKFDLT